MYLKCVFNWSSPFLASCWSEAVQPSSGALSRSLQSLTHIWGYTHTGDAFTHTVHVCTWTQMLVFIMSHLYCCHVQVVLPCLLDVLSVLEKPLVHSALARKPNRFDDVLRHILTYMEMEHKLDLRRVYAKNLVLFIERWGLNILSSFSSISDFGSYDIMFTLKMKYVYCVTVIFVIKHTLQDSFHFQVMLYQKWKIVISYSASCRRKPFFCKTLHLRYTVFVIFLSFLSI